MELLHKLMARTMMRHSKMQSDLAGNSIVPLPTRTVEWRRVALQDESEIYLHA